MSEKWSTEPVYRGVFCTQDIIQCEGRWQFCCNNRMVRLNGCMMPISEVLKTIIYEYGQERVAYIVYVPISITQSNYKVVVCGSCRASSWHFFHISSYSHLQAARSLIVRIDFFDFLLQKVSVVGTPGSGFGLSGEGYFRLSAFNSRLNVIDAMERIINI